MQQALAVKVGERLQVEMDQSAEEGIPLELVISDCASSEHWNRLNLLLEAPREIPPPRTGPSSPRESPRRSFSNALPPWDEDSPLPLELGAGSGSKSINESSLFAFFETPVVVPKVPLGILDAASKSPFRTSL